MWADRNEDCNSRAMVIEWALPIHVLAILSMVASNLKRGECKSWTLDSGLDHGLDYGLKYGLNSRLIFKLLAMVASQGAVLGLGTTQESPH